jgi:ABC-type antimicrobial peptide transport system permease subunit
VCLILTSTLLLSGAVGVATIASSYMAVRWLTPLWLDPATALNAPGYPVWAAAVAMAAAMLAGVAGGVVPAVAAARVNMVQVLRE